MSNLSLALKYRPSTFNDVIEQSYIIQILRNQLKNGTFKNSYLFTGSAGTGKTTCARIMANEINGGHGAPIEIDAASNNGVENVRDIIKNASFKSIDSDYKIYIIDECHMMSTGAWNAMLKLLEEPPLKTVFIFCTTDPQKVPATIMSRVQRYDFQRISYKSILSRLQMIVKKEKLNCEPEALDYIAKVADGGMRDALTLLDKCLSFSDKLKLDDVTNILRVSDYETIIDLYYSVIKKDESKVIAIISRAHEKGIDLKQFIKQFFNFSLDACKYSITQNSGYIQIPQSFEKELKDIIGSFKLPKLKRLMLGLLKVSNDIKWEQSPKAIIIASLIEIMEGLE